MMDYRYSMKFAKRMNEKKNKIKKNEGFFFGQHSLVEKSPTTTEIYIIYCIYICIYISLFLNKMFLFSN